MVTVAVEGSTELEVAAVSVSFVSAAVPFPVWRAAWAIVSTAVAVTVAVAAGTRMVEAVGADTAVEEAVELAAQAVAAAPSITDPVRFCWTAKMQAMGW
jgi:hypothetical protein